MTHEQIAEVLKLHKKWLLDLADGVCADLRYADLRCAELSDADLRNANLRGAELIGADLSDADLSNANLINANLIGANLRGANLNYADLRGTDLRNTDLRGTDLRNADLRYADLRNADLRGAKLEGVKTDYLTVGYHIACPEEGAFIGYKKAGGKIVVLEIPAEARRSSATTLKCRCDKAKVLRIEDADGEIIDVDEDEDFIYMVGNIIVAKNFNPYRWNNYGSGITFYLSKEIALREKFFVDEDDYSIFLYDRSDDTLDYKPIPEGYYEEED